MYDWSHGYINFNVRRVSQASDSKLGRPGQAGWDKKKSDQEEQTKGLCRGTGGWKAPGTFACDVCDTRRQNSHGTICVFDRRDQFGRLNPWYCFSDTLSRFLLLLSISSSALAIQILASSIHLPIRNWYESLDFRGDAGGEVRDEQI